MKHRTLVIALTAFVACQREQGAEVTTSPNEPLRAFPPPGQLIPAAAPAGADTADTGGTVARSAIEVDGPRPESIRVEFDRPMKTFTGRKPAAGLAEGLAIAFVPAHPLDAQWLSDRVLELVPNSPWPLATEYSLRVLAAKSADGTAPTLPAEKRFIVNPLRIETSRSTLTYPETLSDDGLVVIRTSHPVPPEALAKYLEVTSHPTADVDAPGLIEPLTVTAGVNPDLLLVKLDTPPRYSRTYRLRISREMTGVGPASLGEDWVSYARGPTPIAVSSFYCGFSGCTPDSPWSLSFTSEVDPRSLEKCVMVSPSVDLGPPTVEGWSATFKPSNLKVGRKFKVRASGCRDLRGEPMAAAFQEEVEIVAPRPSLQVVGGTGFMKPPDDGEEIDIKVRAEHTGPLAVALARISGEELAGYLSGNAHGSSFDKFTPTLEKRVTPAPRGEVFGVGVTDLLSNRRGLIAYRMTMANPEGEHPVSGAGLVQVTDLGITAKSSPRNTLVWVTSLSDRGPQAGVSVSLLDGEGKSLWEGPTDVQGLAVAPVFDGSRGPKLVVAKRDGDVAFLDLDEWQVQTAPYEFDLPTEWEPVARGLEGMLFTERGVYRSGETVHIKGLIRIEDGGALASLAGEAGDLEVIDPRGEIALTTAFKFGAVSDLELALPLAVDAALGTWSIRASVPTKSEQELSTTFRVEAYRPNTFEVKIDDLTFEPRAASDGDGALDGLKAKVSGRYYHGASLADAPVRWWVSAAAAAIAPPGYEGYTFGVSTWDDTWWEPSGSSTVSLAGGNASLDAEGEAVLDARFKVEGTANATAGPRLITVEASVTDVDSSVVAGRSSLRVESSDHYFGVRTSTQFAALGDHIDVDVAAVTASGKAVPSATATLRWIRRTWVTERVASAGGGTDWVSRMEEKILENRDIELRPETTRVASLTASESGSYVVEVEGRDARGRVIKTRTSLWVWGGHASWDLSESGKLTLVGEKKVWKVGETARFVAQSPFDEAQALITVERNGVITQEVRPLKGAAPLIELAVTDDMRPNAYVSVVLLGQTQGKAPEGEARLGYLELKIDNTDRRLAVAVKPDASEHRPGDRVKVALEVTGADGEPAAGQVTFMAVDEGVLSLTGYVTPDPHVAFHRIRPLSVTTFEARKLLWRERIAQEVKSDWGGGGEGGEATNYRSAFATTAAFMPDVAIGPDGKGLVEFELPDNLTTFRLMAVAASTDGRFGTSESKVVVNRPLTLRPALPRFISVGDSFEARAIVQALSPELAASRAALDVELTVAGPVQLDGTPRTQVEASSKALPVAFKVKALAPGAASFAFRVKGPDGASDAFEVTVPVGWPAPMRSASDGGELGPTTRSEARRIELPAWMHPDVGSLEVTVSPSRMSELLGGLRYLLEYPYGCVEQTTGATLPLLALNELGQGFTLPGITPSGVLERAQAGLTRLRTMQTWSGGLSYWPGETTPHPWGSVYGGLALVMAASHKGLAVSNTTLENLRNYLKSVLTGEAPARTDEWRSELDVVKPFAAWVLALAGAPDASANAALFDKRTELPDFGKLLLALAIADSKGDLKMASTLVDLVRPRIVVEGDRAFLKRDGDRYYHSTMDSDVRNQAILVLALERLNPADPVLPKLAYGLLSTRERGRWISTQDNAFAILALARHFTRTEAHRSGSTVSVALGDTSLGEFTFAAGDLSPKVVRVPMSTLHKQDGKRLAITRTEGDGPVYWTASLDYVPATVDKSSAADGFKVTRTYRHADGKGAGPLVDTLETGDLIAITVEVHTPHDRRYVVIDDPLPAGLEPVTLDFATTGTTSTGREGDDHDYVFNHIEQRDDRVLLFADAMPAGTYQHTYLARATTRGTFLAPATHASEMYHPTVFGLAAARDVTVQ